MLRAIEPHPSHVSETPF